MIPSQRGSDEFAALLMAVVVTANHYLMDGVGGVIGFGIAAATALTLYWARHGPAIAWHHQRLVPLGHGAPGHRGATSEGC